MSTSYDFRDRNARDGDADHFQLGLLDTLDQEDAGDRPRVRISRRARRLSIRVYPDARVEVVAPSNARPRDIESFVAAHRQWIDDKRTLALRNRPSPQPFPPPDLELRCTQEHFHLQLAGGSGSPRVSEVPSTGSDRVLKLAGAAQGRASRNALRAWLMRAARERLEPRVAALAARCGIQYARVSIRRQRSRWGSCSARGTISLNCCLLFQRPEVVDYLIVHELTHVRHMNHSTRFWQAVEKNCAGWRALDRELVQGWRHVPRWVFSDN